MIGSAPPEADLGEELGALALVSTFCDALAAEGIAYCHWKSNDMLSRAVQGKSDLDLLVGPQEAQRLVAVARRLGFKEAQSPPIKQVPGVFHLYGLDEPTGALVHIHGHTRLVLGDDTTKNYRLPIEDAYLRSAAPGERFPLPIPAPEFELVVFVVRMMLKHGTWDAIVSGKGRLASSEARELDFLRRRVDIGRAGEVVRRHMPFIGHDLWERSRQCVEQRRFGPDAVRAAWRLERALAPYARRSPGFDAVVRLERRTRIVFRRHVMHRPPPRGRLERGALIAVVGGDGAGKSTVVDELHGWLSNDLATSRIHLGKPSPSLTSWVVKRVWKGSVRGLMKGPPISGEALAASDGRAMSPRASARLIRQVSVARDRYLTYRKASHLVATGRIVLSDRFPLPEIELMDGPLGSKILRTPDSSSPARYLARLERKYYARILDPDILIVLNVDPDIAAKRKRGIDDEEVVRRRAEEIRRIVWDRVPAFVLDAVRPKDELIASIKSAVWSRL